MKIFFASLLCFFVLGHIASAQDELRKMMQNAPRLEARVLPVTPVCTIRVGQPMWAPNPDGKSCDLILLYYDNTLRDSWIVVVDFGNNSIKTIKHTEYINWHLVWENATVVAPNGKLFFSVIAPVTSESHNEYSQQLCMYDPATNQLHMRVAEIPVTLKGGIHPMVLGTDGWLCMAGFHPSMAACAVQINPDTLQVNDYGAIGPSHAPNDCFGYFCAADDRFIYVASGKLPWYLVAHDKLKQESKVLLTTDNQGIIYIWPNRKDGRMLIQVRAHRVLGETQDKVFGWLKDGELLKTESEEDPPPEAAYHDGPQMSALPPRPELFLENAVPTSEGQAEIWARSPEAKTPDQPRTETTPQQLGWKRYPFQIEPHPQPIHRLLELPDGRLLGTAGDYEGNFIYDPRTQTAKHLGKIKLSHYATAMDPKNGKVYMSGYPSSPVYVYDLDQPWNAGQIGRRSPVSPPALAEKHPDSNPRLLTLLMEDTGAHKMYAGAWGADDKAYFGGRWYRNGSGGGFGWWDPATETSGGFWKPLSNFQITHMTAADENRYIVISARRKQDEILKKPTPKEGALFIFDTVTGTIIRQDKPVLNVIGPGPVAAVGQRVVGWTQPMGQSESSILWGLDVTTGKVMFRNSLPFPLPIQLGSNQKENFDFRLGPDRHIWTMMAFENSRNLTNGYLVRIHPADGSIQVVGKLRQGGRMAFSDDDVYLSGYPQLRQIKGIVGQHVKDH